MGFGAVEKRAVEFRKAVRELRREACRKLSREAVRELSREAVRELVRKVVRKLAWKAAKLLRSVSSRSGTVCPDTTVLNAVCKHFRAPKIA